jgi:ABC-2 type transport system permease protein
VTGASVAGNTMRRHRPMTTWRLEWLRMTRTPGAAALAGVYLTFGLLGPVLAKYMQQIVAHLQSNVRIVTSIPTPKDGIANYINQVGQTGLVVVAVVAGSALTFDARPGLSTFLRTRAKNMLALLLPRIAVAAATGITAYTLGTLGAWYETALLIAPPPPGAILAGMLCGSLYLLFAVCLVATAASLARSVLGTVGLSVSALLLLPLAGSLPALHQWLPSTLAGAPVELLAGAQLTDYTGAAAISVLLGCALIAVAVSRLRHREV